MRVVSYTLAPTQSWDEVFIKESHVVRAVLQSAISICSTSDFVHLTHLVRVCHASERENPDSSIPGRELSSNRLLRMGG